MLIALALLGSLSACNDGTPITQPRDLRSGVAPAASSVTAPLTALSHPQTIVAASTLNNVTSVLPIHQYSSFDVGQKPSEFVEGAIFAGTEQPDPVTGTVRLLQAVALDPASNRLYWPPAGVTIGPVRGLAIDILEYDGRGKIPGYQDFEGLLKGRLWVATGGPGLTSRLHVLAGRGDVAFRSSVELAQITPTALIPAGESLRALVAAPPNLVLFAASETRLIRIIPSTEAAASTLEAFADIPAADGQSIAGLAAAVDGRLYVLRRGDAGFSVARFEAATLAPAPAAPSAFPLGAAPGLISPTAIAVNSADHLVIAERASGLLYELDAAGALVTVTAAITSAATIPQSPATATGNDTPVPAGANQLAAIFCDVYLSRIVLATDPTQTGNGGTAAVRTMANVSLSGGVKPILENRCIFCHASGTPLGGLDLSGEPAMIRARLLGRACETFAADDPTLPGECAGLPAQNPFFRNDIPVLPSIPPAVLSTPGVTCPQCPYPLPLARVEPFAPTRSYVILKLLTTAQAPLVFFPTDLAEATFTNNCGALTDGTLDPGEVCGERMPLASFLQRPIRRAEIEMIEKWIRRGAPED